MSNNEYKTVVKMKIDKPGKWRNQLLVNINT